MLGDAPSPFTLMTNTPSPKRCSVWRTRPQLSALDWRHAGAWRTPHGRPSRVGSSPASSPVVSARDAAGTLAGELERSHPGAIASLHEEAPKCSL